MSTHHQTHKVELIRKLVALGHGETVRQILLGVSSYSMPNIDVANTYPAAFESRSSKGLHFMTWVHTHLEFTTKFGSTVTEAKEGKKVFFAHHTEYEEWLHNGAPGIHVEELEACAADLRCL